MQYPDNELRPCKVSHSESNALGSNWSFLFLNLWAEVKAASVQTQSEQAVFEKAKEKKTDHITDQGAAVALQMSPGWYIWQRLSKDFCPWTSN